MSRGKPLLSKRKQSEHTSTTQRISPMNYISGRDEDGVLQVRQKQKPAAARPKQAPMPKVRALALVQKLKGGLVAASILCFRSLGWLGLSHTSVATAAQTTTKQATTQ